MTPVFEWFFSKHWLVAAFVMPEVELVWALWTRHYLVAVLAFQIVARLRLRGKLL